MTKFKIFFGESTHRADELANEWLAKHLNIKITTMKYQQARYGDHSICIMYEEE